MVRLEKLSAEKIQLEEERARLDARLHEFSANVEQQKLSALAQRGSVEERQKRLAELSVELQSVTKQQDQLLEQQAESFQQQTLLNMKLLEALEKLSSK